MCVPATSSKGAATLSEVPVAQLCLEHTRSSPQFTAAMCEPTGFFSRACTASPGRAEHRFLQVRPSLELSRRMCERTVVAAHALVFEDPAWSRAAQLLFHGG